MTHKLLITFLVSVLTGAQSLAVNKSIYGQDDRIEFTQIESREYREWARSTAAMIPDLIIRDHTDDLFRIKSKMLTQQGICPYERFARQLTAAECSGFLIAPDKIATAGHCVVSKDDCRYMRWVFDYTTSEKYKIGRRIQVPKTSVYKCQKVITQKWDEDLAGSDYAVIQLDRPVLDREPLKLRTSGQVSVGDPLVIIGYPSGLPLKLARGGVVTGTKHKHFFTSSVDSFSGNSGSVIINERTGLVEGILARGGEDYHWEKRKGKRCLVPTTCKIGDEHCEGEDVSRISEILDFI